MVWEEHQNRQKKLVFFYSNEDSAFLEKYLNIKIDDDDMYLCKLYNFNRYFITQDNYCMCDISPFYNINVKGWKFISRFKNI